MSHYSVISVNKSLPPQGQDGDDWCCYVIASATSTIVGYRRGSPGETRKVARDCVTQFNGKLQGLPPARHFVRHAYPVADTDPLSAA